MGLVLCAMSVTSLCSRIAYFFSLSFIRSAVVPRVFVSCSYDLISDSVYATYANASTR